MIGRNRVEETAESLVSTGYQIVHCSALLPKKPIPARGRSARPRWLLIASASEASANNAISTETCTFPNGLGCAAVDKFCMSRWRWVAAKNFDSAMLDGFTACVLRQPVFKTTIRSTHSRRIDSIVYSAKPFGQGEADALSRRSARAWFVAVNHCLRSLNPHKLQSLDN